MNIKCHNNNCETDKWHRCDVVIKTRQISCCPLKNVVKPLLQFLNCINEKNSKIELITKTGLERNMVASTATVY